MNYNQLLSEERYVIDLLFNIEKKTISEIAVILKRNKSTISREIRRNSAGDNYFYKNANDKYKQRQWHKHAMKPLKWSLFTTLFIAFYNKRNHGVKATWYKIDREYSYVKKPSLRQVFNWIKHNRWYIKFKDRLRRRYHKGGKRTVGIIGPLLRKKVKPIWVRPKRIDLRVEPGHYEADLIVGKRANGFANLLTFTERVSRKTFIRKVRSKDPWHIASETKKLIEENNLVVKSITIDNGIEFEKYGLLAKWIKTDVYVCMPYASWQRGSNEHTNGIIRRYFPKGFNFNDLTDEDIFNLQENVNNMPRELFNWLTANQIFKNM